MIAGQLKEVIQVETPVVNASEYGLNSIEEYKLKIARTRASVKYQKGTRENDNGDIFFAHSVVFGVRSYHDIDELDRILWKGKRYRILNIERQREANQIIISTELINE